MLHETHTTYDSAHLVMEHYAPNLQWHPYSLPLFLDLTTHILAPGGQVALVIRQHLTVLQIPPPGAPFPHTPLYTDARLSVTHERRRDHLQNIGSPAFLGRILQDSVRRPVFQGFVQLQD